jgi:peptidoglycan/xylan/chitin deacetylase (PgdA/CDA1 family)
MVTPPEAGRSESGVHVSTSSLTAAAADALAPLVPLGAARCLLGSSPLAVFYHVVCERPLPHLAHLYSFHTPQAFEAEIRLLLSRFHFVSADDLRDHYSMGSRLPSRAAHLSFDDGLEPCFTVVRPILLRLGVPCTFFACSDYVDNRRIFHRHVVSLCLEALEQLERPSAVKRALGRVSEIVGSRLRSSAELASWLRARDQHSESALRAVADELEVDLEEFVKTVRPFMSAEQLVQLQDDGFQVGAHGRSHSDLRRMQPEEVRDEIVHSSRSLSQLLGRSGVPFAFPYSGEGVSRELLEQVLRDEPSVHLFFDSQWPRKDAPFVVQRLSGETSPSNGCVSSPITRLVKRSILRELRRRLSQDPPRRRVADS